MVTDTAQLKDALKKQLYIATDEIVTVLFLDARATVGYTLPQTTSIGSS